MKERPTGHADFSMLVSKPIDLGPTEIDTAIELVTTGAAVDTGRLRTNLLACAWIALASAGNDLAGVGAIKSDRRQYDVRIALKSEYDLPSECRELGYVSVLPKFQGNHLSTIIVGTLVQAYKGDLFATTFNPRMKHTLSKAGFLRLGCEWPSVESPGALVSLWVLRTAISVPGRAVHQ
jgi:hypothetical protein